MKKVLALILSLTLIVSALVLPGATIVSAAAESEFAFSDAITVLSNDISPRAIRTKVLSDGTVAAVYYRSGSGIFYATSSNGGVTFSEGVKIIGNAKDSELAESEEVTTQTTLAKEYVAKYGPYGRGRLEAQNPNLVELKNGDVAAFYRYNTFETDPENKPWGIYYASICYQILDKETGVWGDVQVMYECTEENVVADSGSPYGVWEPDPVYIGDELFCYFADTDLPRNTNYQHIMYCVYDEESGKFSAPEIAQNGIEHKSRDGMSVVTKLTDGTYAMVFESTRTAKSDYEDIHNYTTFVIKMSFSNDGRNWSEPVIVAKPNAVTAPATGSNEYAVCAAPYVVTLPDGRLAVSYQTTDRYTGRIPNRVSYRIGTQVAVSSQPITSATFADKTENADVTSYFATELNPGVLGENEFSKSAELMVNNNKLYVYYSVGNNSWPITNGVETEKHDFGDIRMAYIDLTADEVLDANSRDNYVVYNNSGKNVTVSDGAFVLPNGCTNMLYGEEYRDSEPAEFDVDVSYDAADYTTKGQSGYGFTTDADAKTINFTASKQAKAQLDYVADAKNVDIDVTMKGNTSGTIWGGVAFHTQESDFNSAAFNTAGYSVYLVRSSSALNKLTLYVRYCTENGTDAHTYQPVLTTALSTDKNLKLRLQVSVGDNTFSVKALSEDGSIQYGDTMTYNLDDTKSYSKTKYYETGKINLITNGIHTFSNLSITRTTQEVEVSYNANNYATNGQDGYGFTADAENKTLNFTAGKQAKAMLKYVKSAKLPEIDVTMKGDSKGTIWGGVAFHVQESDFANAPFNTAGYSVYLVRSASTLNKLTLYVRYCTENGVNAYTYMPVLTTELPTDVNLKLRLQVSVDATTFTVKALSEDGSIQYGETKTYNLDDTAAQSKTKYYEDGKIALITNGIHTFSNISITNKTRLEKYGNMVKAADLDATATINYPATLSNDNQVGMSFRVQSAVDKPAPGVSGYVVKLLQYANFEDKMKIQLTRYGTKADGTTNANLGDMYTENTAIDGNLSGKSVIVDAKLRDDILIITLTDAADASVTSTHTFNLKKASGSYSDYYEYGGFGFFKNGNATDITVSDVSFTKLAKNVNKIADDSAYTVYRPESNEEVTYEDNAFVNNDSTTKKIMLNDTLVSNFKADATLEVGIDGNLKGGIIFRAQNVGRETNDMDGYSVVVYKTPNTTTNYGRMVLLVYKWARLANGKMDYMGTVGSKVFLDTFNSVYPEAESDLLAAAGAKVKLNVEVKGDTVTANFDVLNKDNIVAASTDDVVVKLDNTLTGVDKNKVFADDAASVMYNAGEIGLSISTLGKICDFNLIEAEDEIETSDIDGYDFYSSNDTTLVRDTVNNKIYSTTAGQKQAVLSDVEISNFKASARMKSTSAGATYNMGFDFMINEATHSGAAYNTNHATMGYEGYRLVLVRNANSSTNPAGTTLYLFKFTKGDTGYTRTQVKTASNSNFFADYTAYGEIEVDFAAELVDGKLTATATVCEHTDKKITLTYDGLTGTGSTGWFISGGGSLTGLSVKTPLKDSLVTATDCTNGSVYAGINSGAAKVGDDVKVIGVGDKGYRIDEAFVNGKAIAEGENGYVFKKECGAAEISATFFLVGDLDKDGKAASATDISNLRNDLLGKADIADKYADINDDNKVNLKDLVNIKKISAGIEN